MSTTKTRMCPLIDGTRNRRLKGLNKLAEIGVILIALFVLQEVRSDVIPFGCPVSAKMACLRQTNPDASQFLPGICDDARASCYDTVGSFPNGTTAVQAGFPESYNSTFAYCQCLVYSVVDSSGSPRPGKCTFSNIFPILIFVIGAALIIVMELLLQRKITALVMWLSCELYFVMSYIIVAGLSWGDICVGERYDSVVSILAALVIGQCIFFGIAFGLMMLGAAKKIPGKWIVYDVTAFTAAKYESRRQRAETARASMLLNRPPQFENQPEQSP